MARSSSSWVKGKSGNPFGNGRDHYLKRFGVMFNGQLLLPSEIAKIIGISDRALRMRFNKYPRKYAATLKKFYRVW